MHTLHHHMQPHMARAENAQAVGTGATQGYCQAAYVRRSTPVDTRACAASNIGSTQSTCMALTSSVPYSSSKYALNSLHNFETSSMRRLKTAKDAFFCCHETHPSFFQKPPGVGYSRRISIWLLWRPQTRQLDSNPIEGKVPVGLPP